MNFTVGSGTVERLDEDMSYHHKKRWEDKSNYYNTGHECKNVWYYLSIG